MTATDSGCAGSECPTAPERERVDPGRRGGAHAHGLKRPRDWEWRRRIRSNPQSRRIYRTIIATLGLVIVLVGLVAVPLPGPGWLIVFIGVSIWASEFHWARRLHEYGVGKVREWDAWVRRRSFAVRAGLAVLTCVFVNAFLWGMLKLTGVPGWVPDQVTEWMHTYLAL
ncbi:TIGR02611 family protein [Mobilicoccus massiliensis]|uniref:TIGR02611 family protein n=1 Tax=Mobilicoccus massiliensis TaxID=1522310 RepID=UPI000694A4B0|nr:TIGR02611 family protein [Mobilicoccus massiliensis]